MRCPPLSSNLANTFTLVVILSFPCPAVSFQPISPSRTTSPINNLQQPWPTCCRADTALSMFSLATLDVFFQTSPYTAAAIACGFKASAADLVAQKRQVRKRDEKQLAKTDGTTDLKRNFAFLLYGSLYQGVTQEFVYNHLYPRAFGAGTTIAIVLAKVAFDLLVQTTLVTLPVAYLTKALIYNYSPREALSRYKDDVMNHGLLKKYYMLWGPVQCVTFGIIPEHFRVTFIAFVSFFWLIILSSITSRSKPKPVLVLNADDDFTEEELNTDDCELIDGLTCSIDG